MRRWVSLTCIIMILSLTVPLQARHDIRPASLIITEEKVGQFNVHWRLPITNTQDNPLIKLEFPAYCLSLGTDRIGQNIDGWRLETWTLSCPLDREEIKFNGLALTITDVFVRVDYLDRPDVSALVNASSPFLVLERDQQSTSGVGAYLGLGLDHILSGYDHILFTIGLFLLVGIKRIFPVLLSFTIAHGVTLLLTIAGGLKLPGPIVEILIASSLVLLAKEILARQQGNQGLTARWPTIISFGFGLVHGAGFSGALTEIGLPSGQVLTALALFNIGVEVGQIAVLALYALSFMLLSRTDGSIEKYVRIASIYTIGGVGMYWVMDRSWSLFV